MSDSTWLSIISVVITAVAAISGTVGWFLGYRKAKDDTARNLRLELFRAVSDARGIVGRLPGLMVDADNSRRGVLNARGLLNSSYMTAWTTSIDADRKDVVSLKDELSGLDNDYTATTDYAQLESCLASMYDLTRRAAEMRSKYAGEIANDEKARDRLAADRRTRLLKRQDRGTRLLGER